MGAFGECWVVRCGWYVARQGREEGGRLQLCTCFCSCHLSMGTLCSQQVLAWLPLEQRAGRRQAGLREEVGARTMHIQQVLSRFDRMIVG